MGWYLRRAAAAQRVMISRQSARRPSIRRTKSKKAAVGDAKACEGVSLSTCRDFRFSGHVLQLHESKGWQRRLLTFDGEVLRCLSKNAQAGDKPKWEVALAQVEDIRILESPKGPLMRTKQPPSFVIDHADQHTILRLPSTMEFECWMFTLGNCWTRPPTQPGSNSAYDACLDAWNRGLDDTLSDSSSGVKFMSPSPPAKVRIAEAPPKIRSAPVRRPPASKAAASRNSLAIPTHAVHSVDSLVPHRRNRSANPNPRIVALSNDHAGRSFQKLPSPEHALHMKLSDHSHRSRPRSLDPPHPNHTKLRGWAVHPSGVPVSRPQSFAPPPRPLHFSSPQPLARFSQY